MSKPNDDHQLRRMAIGLIALVMLYHAEKATAAVVGEFAVYSSFMEGLHHFLELDEKAEIGLVVLAVIGAGGWIGGLSLGVRWVKSFFRPSHRKRGATALAKPTFFERVMRAIEAFFRSGVL